MSPAGDRGAIPRPFRHREQFGSIVRRSRAEDNPTPSFAVSWGCRASDVLLMPAINALHPHFLTIDTVYTRDLQEAKALLGELA